MESVRNIIIGSGEGGKYLAWHLAAAGEPTIVVERRLIGGSCPNTNCLPSKNEIWSAKVADLVRRSASFGTYAGCARVDMAAVRARKQRMVEGLIRFNSDRFKSSGAQLVMGEAEFIGNRTVGVRLNAGGVRQLEAERLFLNLGTRATLPAILGLLETRPLTNESILELDRLPDHLIVMGGGFVGVEFAQAFRRFGSRVTVIQRTPQLLAGHDSDVANEVLAIMRDEGIHVILSAEIVSASGMTGQGLTVNLKTAGGPLEVSGTDILVATGRTPNTAEIGLDKLGVARDPRGYIKVNDRLETTAPNVWAIGECAGSPQFTHASLDDYRVIRDNLAGNARSTRDRLMPSCLFTDPQTAQIGLTEIDAARRGVSVRVVKLPMASVLRTHTLDEKRGFMKALIDPQSDRVLGFAMVGPEAGEVMAVVQTAMLAGQPFTMLRDAILAHPTMAEGLNALFSMVKPSPKR